jgi:hypothetical protein
LTFNLYNFSAHDWRHEAAGMDEDRLISAVSLPMVHGRDRDSLYVDAVMATDANLEEAIDAAPTSCG